LKVEGKKSSSTFYNKFSNSILSTTPIFGTIFRLWGLIFLSIILKQLDKDHTSIIEIITSEKPKRTRWGFLKRDMLWYIWTLIFHFNLIFYLFIFILFIFPFFFFFFYLISWTIKRHVTIVTCHITWYYVIGPEYSEKN